MKKLKGDTIPGIVATVFGILVLIAVLADPTNMEFATVAKKGFIPGPGFFPLVCGILITVLGLALTVRGIRQNGTVEYFKLTPEVKGNIAVALKVFAGLIVFLILWNVTSSMVPSFMIKLGLSSWFVPLVFVYAIYLGVIFKRSWKFTVIFAIIMTALIYGMFVKGFSVTFRTY